MKTTVHIEVALDAFKTTQLYRAKCTHTVGTSAHLFDLSSSVVKAFQELVLNLTIYSTSSFTATGVHFHGCCSAGIWLIHFVPLSEYLAIWIIIYTQFCVFQKTEAETKTRLFLDQNGLKEVIINASLKLYINLCQSYTLASPYFATKSTSFYNWAALGFVKS